MGERHYQVDSRERERRAVFKTEVLPKRSNERFVVINRTEEKPLTLYNWSAEPGKAEGWVKDLKNTCCADRFSCMRIWANQFRLLLHTAAYWLLDTLRRWLVHAGSARGQLSIKVQPGRSPAIAF